MIYEKLQLFFPHIERLFNGDQNPINEQSENSELNYCSFFCGHVQNVLHFNVGVTVVASSSEENASYPLRTPQDKINAACLSLL